MRAARPCSRDSSHSWASAAAWVGRFKHMLAAAALALPLAACAQATSNLPPIPASPMPQPGAIAQLPPYRVQIGDVLDVKLFLNPELNDEVTVRPDGMISTAVAHDIPAYNRTPMEITAALLESYKSNLSNPQISVIVHSFAPNRIYVAGEVNSPGEFVTIGPNLTISQAVARAGGVKLGADRHRIFVLRRGLNDVPQAFSVDYMGIISAERPTADVRLAQYDVIYVPRTGIYETWTYWNQFLQQFVPMSWGFSYNINPIVR
jgi:polysaccharide biosynthesis/export protein